MIIRIQKKLSALLGPKKLRLDWILYDRVAGGQKKLPARISYSGFVMALSSLEKDFLNLERKQILKKLESYSKCC